MKAGPPNDSPQNMREDDDHVNDPVWRLLAQAPRPEPDAWFAARTLARCRHEGVSGGSDDIISLARFGRMWRWALGGGLALSMAVTLVVTQIQSEKVDKQKNVQEAFEIMASVDNDSDSSSSSSSWQDSSL
jgi:hypothetical protein